MVPKQLDQWNWNYTGYDVYGNWNLEPEAFREQTYFSVGIGTQRSRVNMFSPISVLYRRNALNLPLIGVT